MKTKPVFIARRYEYAEMLRIMCETTISFDVDVRLPDIPGDQLITALQIARDRLIIEEETLKTALLHCIQRKQAVEAAMQSREVYRRCQNNQESMPEKSI